MGEFEVNGKRFYLLSLLGGVKFSFASLHRREVAKVVKFLFQMKNLLICYRIPFTASMGEKKRLS